MENMGSKDLLDKLKDMKHRLDTMGVMWQAETIAVPYGSGTHEFWLHSWQLVLGLNHYRVATIKTDPILDSKRPYIGKPCECRVSGFGQPETRNSFN